MKHIIYLALISLLGLSSCITINRRYEYKINDTTDWKYDDGRGFYKENYDKWYFKYGYDPKEYYCYKTDKFTINIKRVEYHSNLYSFGVLLPIIPRFLNLEDSSYNRNIAYFSCLIKSIDSLRLKNCYLDVDSTYKLRLAIGLDRVDWVNGKAYFAFDTNKVLRYKRYGLEFTELTLRYNLPGLVKVSAVLYFDSVYVDNKLVNIPPLSLKKEYVIYIDEEVHKLP